MERTKKSLEKNLDKLQKNHDDTVTFEQLGIDKLFVDEAHEFKNLFTPTKMTNISGISNSASQKALDLFMKSVLDEKTGGKGVCFCNRYAQRITLSTLKNTEIPHFFKC